MYVSWGDLDHVQQAGDYPFRDGIITVTFAEIAAWKQNPGVQFELMRKYPLQTQVRYALGKQNEKSLPSTPQAEPFHESSNGDSWWLIADPASGAPAVLHRPSPASGGQVSMIEVNQFLRLNPESPEHLALRRLNDAKAMTATILIAYDLHYPRSEAYDRLIEAIKAFGSWWHHLETVWIVRSTISPAEVRERLKSYIGEDDQLLVIDISRATAEWLGINEVGTQWLKDLQPKRIQ